MPGTWRALRAAAAMTSVTVVALLLRLQRDEQAAVIRGRVRPAGADRGVDVVDRRIGLQDARRRLRCRSFIASKEVSVAASVTPIRKPVSSCGKKPFGTIDVELDGAAEGREASPAASATLRASTQSSVHS